jgi:hypothetical protein
MTKGSRKTLHNSSILNVRNEAVTKKNEKFCAVIFQYISTSDHDKRDNIF